MVEQKLLQDTLGDKIMGVNSLADLKTLQEVQSKNKISGMLAGNIQSSTNIGSGEYTTNLRHSPTH